MYQNILIAATIIAVLLVYFGSMFVTVLLVKHKINVSGAIAEAKAAIPVFEQVETVLVNLMPQPYKSMSAIIVSYIKKAVELAEDMNIAGQLTADQRKAKALELVNSALALEKVTVTAKISNAISLAIDLAAILFVPHKVETATAVATAQ